MNAIRPILATLLTLATGLSAQTLSSDVVRNPDETVTYTFDFQGPPRGSAYLFVAPFLSPVPLPIAPFGILHLDPLSMLSIGSVPLDGTGTGRMAVTVPGPVTNGVFIASQALFLDTNFTPRLSLNWCGLLAHDLNLDLPESLVWSTNGGMSTRVQFQGSARFHRIVYRDHTGAVLGQCNLETTLPGNKTPKQDCGLVRPLRKGDTYETWESGDGQQWTPSRAARPLP